MEKKMILNLIHKPSPGRSMRYARIQLDTAHRLGIKCTNLMMFRSLFDDEVIAIVRRANQEYGDEIGLLFLGFECEEFRNEFGHDEFCFWLYSFQDRKRIIDLAFGRFYELFSFYPRSVGSYYMDSQSLAYIKRKYPSVEIATATCFEEGVNTFHGCNNTWYLFSEGGPWAPWIPSKANVHCPARDEDEDVGVVAIPHLSRDLLLSISGRHDFFASHPQNIMRGMVNDGLNYPYMFNMLEELIEQAEWNGGYSYCMINVSPGWMSRNGCYEQSEEVLTQSYIDCLEYLAEKKAEGVVVDMQMCEYARWFREHKAYDTPTIGLWRDLLYGSKKRAFWYIDPNYRIAIDPAQGGAIVDLRAYSSRVDCSVGPDTDKLWYASYPYIIQTNHRAGYFTHSGEGTMFSCRVAYRSEVVDLCTCRTKGSYDSEKRAFVLDPVEIRFPGLVIKLQSRYRLGRDGNVYIEREILESSDQDAVMEVTEYLNGCYGITEYPEDMRGVRLQLFRDGVLREEIVVAYQSSKAQIEHPDCVKAVIPSIDTTVSLMPQYEAKTGVVREGHLFSPVFTMALVKDLRVGEAMVTCLRA
jgi:hypothetical protein